MAKRLPSNKTVVAEYKVHLADILTRTMLLKGSVAAPVAIDAPFNTGDITVSALNALHLPATNSILVLSSLSDFVVNISDTVTSVELLCRGLFINNGATGMVVVTPPAGIENVRLQYIWS